MKPYRPSPATWCGMALATVLSFFPASWCPAADAPAADDPYAELARLDTLSEVMRHLYRWYLDEASFDGLNGSADLVFHIRPVHPALDEGDRSRYAEILIPFLSTVVQMKKTDYTIEELGIEVRSDRFKIVNVERVETLPMEPAPPETVRFPTRDMLAYLFETRAQPDFPSPELTERLKTSIQHQVREYQQKVRGDRTVFIAPLSPVANEIWAFWQEAGLLVRWASDIELANPAVWEHESLATKVYDIEEQVVIAFAEAPGSNAYLTRDQVGRVLYNCVVLGKKLVIKPPAEPAAPIE